MNALAGNPEITIPLVIGVTGHRDLRPGDVPALEEQVERIFKELAEEHRGVPQILLSPLAEGADRLAARVALRCRAKLIVPLPLPRDEYRKDFEHQGDPALSRASQREFEELLKQAEFSFELPLVAGNTPQSIQSYGEPRNRQYAAVGVHVLQHSQVLIALWDGQPQPEKTGGTAQIVRYRQAGGIPRELAANHSALNLPEPGLIYHVVTRREGGPGTDGAGQPAGRTYCGQGVLPGKDAAGEQESHRRRFGEVRDRMRGYCEDAERWCGRSPSAVAASANDLLADAKAVSLAPHLQRLRRQFAVADSMACDFQRQRVRTMQLLFGLPAAMVFCFEIFDEAGKRMGGPVPWLGAYLVLAAASILIFLRARGRRVQEKHMDYRALAEGLRVQFFWRVAGLPEEAADHYLRKHCGELEWIRKTIQVWSLAGAEVPAGTAGPQAAWGLEYWVNSQAAYFSRKAAEKTARYGRFERLARGFFWVSMALYVALFVVLVSATPPGSATTETAEAALAVSATLLLAGSAIFHGYPEKLAWEPEVRQYEQMATAFSQAAKLLSGQSGLRMTQHVLLDLGKEALNENGDWVSLHRERPLEMPRG